MAANAIAFIKALGLTQGSTLLGWSIGGLIAQEISTPGWRSRSAAHSCRHRAARSRYVNEQNPRRSSPASTIRRSTSGSASPLLAVRFQAGPQVSPFWNAKTHARKDRDPELSEEAAAAQRRSHPEIFRASEGVLDYLKDIRQPTLVVNAAATMSWCPR